MFKKGSFSLSGLKTSTTRVLKIFLPPGSPSSLPEITNNFYMLGLHGSPDFLNKGIEGDLDDPNIKSRQSRETFNRNRLGEGSSIVGRIPLNVGY